MKKNAEELQALCERLKLEAQIHAQEARTANATIAEIYQLVTGKTGEPGNWNGAEPVRAALARIRADALEEAAKLAESDEFYGSAVQHAIAAAIRALAEEPKG